MMPIISLTTTPARKREIEPTLNSLLLQGYAVHLWVPRLLSSTGEAFGEWPAFFGRVNAQWVDDEGPITKILPAFRAGFDTVLTADDDMIYGNGWASGLIAFADRNPGAAIAYRGRDVQQGGAYKQARPIIGHEQIVTFVTGVYGALYRREHFDPRIYTEWRGCPTNDDVVISAHLQRRGIPIVIATPAPDVHATDSTETAPLYPSNNRGVTQDGIDRLMWRAPEIVRDAQWGVADIVKMMDGREAFAFSRWGDGEWIAILGTEPSGMNCDGHRYFPELGEALRDVLRRRPHYLMGLQEFALTACGDRVFQWLRENGLADSYWVESDIFHHAAKAGDWTWKQKLTRGPHIMVAPSHLRRLFPRAIAFIETPDRDCWLDRERITTELSAALEKCTSWVAVGFCASMLSEVLIDDMVRRFPANAYLDFGSVFDPLAGINSRKYMREALPAITETSRVVCMASIPERAATLAKVVATIAPQCDRLCIYLNGHHRAPDFLKGYRNIEVILAGKRRDNPDKGPDGKFHWCDELPPCYMLTVDDDIGYPSDYVATMVAGVDRYERHAACCMHGTVLHAWREGRVSPCGREYDRTAYSYRAGLDRDSLCNVPGSGTMAWHSGTVRIPARIPGDIYPVDPRVAEWLWQHHIPAISLKRDIGYLEYWSGAAHTGAIYADTRKVRAGIEWLYSRPHPWNTWAPDSRAIVYDNDVKPGKWSTPTPNTPGLRGGSVDAVILYREQGAGGEIRQTVAGLRKHVAGLRNIFVIGDDPHVSGVRLIPHGDAHNGREVNMICKTIEACISSRISDPFLLCADDEIIVAPVDLQCYPLHISEPGGNAGYQERVEHTKERVLAAGWQWGYFDGHVPILVWKDAYIEAMRAMPWDKPGPGILCRSPYACLMATRGAMVRRVDNPKHTGTAAGGFVMAGDAVPVADSSLPGIASRRRTRRRGDRL